MIIRRTTTLFCWALIWGWILTTSLAAQPAAPTLPPAFAAPAQTSTTANVNATILGTVLDTNGDAIPGASITVRNPTTGESHPTVANDTGFYKISDLAPTTYQIIVRAPDFADWSTTVSLTAGQVKIVTGTQLRIMAHTAIEVSANSETVALAEVKQEEHQLVLGFIPNFYVTYDKNPAPLTPALKRRLAWKVALNPVTWAGILVLSAADQGADTPNYQQGWLGFGQRVGANAADGFSNIMIGGYLLPSVLHQDPRYFYQGEGPVRSRVWHAVEHPFVCKGDNGKMQVNFSSMGGDLGSSALSNLYYPNSNRGASLVFTNFAISTVERMVSALAQEFIIPKFTPSLKHHGAQN